MGRTRQTLKVEPIRKKYLNIQEAMNYLGCGEKFIRNLKDNNLIRAFRLTDKTFLYDVDSIDRYVESRECTHVV
ncbi:helix-turn-helix domain-containing protein [Bacteroides sp. An19]|uniref:helix-turn-helix domain-containing protein n=1 Tax=Bacteroides sp. An19 TaxID=1965580 RepID=UPI000B36C03A|nr:helix-turn-helix domain-containing protein [Bacteroides sp. An19]OUP32016.1 hypothetical protein B5F25_09770 [Bacteroides sp. An19]